MGIVALSVRPIFLRPTSQQTYLDRLAANAAESSCRPHDCVRQFAGDACGKIGSRRRIPLVADCWRQHHADPNEIGDGHQSNERAHGATLLLETQHPKWKKVPKLLF
jgi:hypothetical protein